MEEKNLTITLSDGTQLSNITMNSTNYVSKTKVTEATFEGKLRTVTIDDGENQVVLEHVELVQITKVGKNYWFVLYAPSAEEVAFKQMEANIEYIAAMTDIDL